MSGERVTDKQSAASRSNGFKGAKSKNLNSSIEEPPVPPNWN